MRFFPKVRGEFPYNNKKKNSLSLPFPMGNQRTPFGDIRGKQWANQHPEKRKNQEKKYLLVASL